jgi:hypothetical protein
MTKLTRAQKETIVKAAAEIAQAQEEKLSRHKRLCEICKHPACLFIEEAFLRWTSPEFIMKKYGLKSRATIYHHAHALQLFARRDRTLRFALGHIIEQADRVTVSARDVIQAVFTYAHVNDDGLWMQPSSKSEILVSKNGPEAGLLDSFEAAPLAREGAKPTTRRRRLKSPQQPEKLPPEADLLAAYVHVAAPDPAKSTPASDFDAVRKAFFANVPRPVRDPATLQPAVLISTNEAGSATTK